MDLAYWSTILPILFVILCLLRATRRDPRVQKHLKKFPGPPDLPIVGNALQFLNSPHENLFPILVSLWSKYGSGFRIWIGNQPYVILAQGSHVEKLLSSTVHLRKSTDYDFLLDKWLGQGLLTARPEKWHSRRKLLTPSFHFQILEEFIGIFNEHANTLSSLLGTSHSGDGNYFDIFPYITRCTLDIICETAMGIKLEAQNQNKEKEDLEYVKAVYGVSEIFIKKFFRPWLQVPFLWALCPESRKEQSYIKTLHEFTHKVIRDRKAERNQHQRQYGRKESYEEVNGVFTRRRKAFLDLLLDAAEKDASFTDTDIREETDTFMFEGHDTTSANLVWTIFLLALHPEHQKLVQAELDSILEEGNPQRDFTSSDFSRMRYLDCCMKETLRLYPSVPMMLRRLTEDLDLGDGRVIPHGVNVAVTPYTLHRDPKVFPSPEVFNPCRFHNSSSASRNPYAYVPFSAGPRNCIGQKFALLEAKAILGRFFHTFTVETRTTSMDQVKMIPELVLRPFGGIHVKIYPRKQLPISL